MSWLDTYGKIFASKDSTKNNIDWMVLEPGENRLRLVRDPKKSEDDLPFKECFKHFLHGLLPQGVKLNRTVVCWKPNYCPICELFEQLKREDNPKGQQIRPQKRLLFVCFDRKHPKNDEGVLTPKFIEFGPMIGKEIFKIASDWGDLTDPAEGYDIIVNHFSNAKTGLTNYTTKAIEKMDSRARSKSIEYSPLTEEELEVLNDFPDLEKINNPSEDVEAYKNLRDFSQEPKVFSAPNNPALEGVDSSPIIPVQPVVPVERSKKLTLREERVRLVLQSNPPESNPFYSQSPNKTCVVFGSFNVDDDICMQCSDLVACHTKQVS